MCERSQKQQASSILSALPTPPLARNVLDLATYERSDLQLLVRLCQRPNTRIVLLYSQKMESGVLMRGGQMAIAHPTGTNRPVKPTAPDQLLIAAPVLHQALSEGRSAFLGYYQDEAYLSYVFTDFNDPVFQNFHLDEVTIEGLAKSVNPGDTAPAQEPQWQVLRLRRFADFTPEIVSSTATRALALHAWHALHRFCSQCSSQTVVIDNGWARRCPHCESIHFPRQDPVVINAVIDEADRLLLAHNANWKDPQVSLVAGFVDAGEDLENAVRREVNEEVGLQVEQLRYLASQPWPFPRSFMVAFACRAVGNQEIRVDGQEITWARFYARSELEQAIVQGQVTIPGTASIARAVIDAWRSGPLL